MAQPNVSDVSDRELVGRLADADAAAFRILIERYLRAMVSVARRMLNDEAEAEDVAQEAFLRLWRQGATLDISEQGVRPWLRRVVSNLCIDRIRGRGRITTVEELPEIPEPAVQLKAMEQHEMQIHVEAALSELPERQKLALILFHFEGLSQIEVGAEMGISDEAVESLLSRGRRQLKTSLQADWKSLLSDARLQDN